MTPKAPKTRISYCISHSNVGILCTTPAHPTLALTKPRLYAKYTVKKKKKELPSLSKYLSLSLSLSLSCSCYVCTNSLNAELFAPFSASYFIVMGHTQTQ